MPGGATYTLEASATPESIDRVHGLIEGISTECGLAEQVRFRFETALIEVVGNIVDHASPTAGREVVTISLRIDVTAGGLSAHITDDAVEAEVDIDGAEMPDWDAEGGRGFALSRSLTDALSYRRRDGVNEWQLSCRT